jgi:hypothetical protein
VTGVSFDDLVAVATVGVTRKGLTVSELAGPAAGQSGVLDTADPAAALLDAAALLTVARRAGLRPAPGDLVPGDGGGAESETERELTARAVRALRKIGQSDSQLLADLLTAAGAAGYVLPAPLLPGLLDAAGRDSVLRPAVVGLLGMRGRWLTAYRPDWRLTVHQARAEQPEATGPAGAGGGDSGHGDSGTWRTGGRDERRGFLARLRRRDPAAGRELLAAGWARETGADRAELLGLLRHGLSADDEEFLEAALDDRAAGVRETARLLLGQLPGSAFRRRTAERAAPVLRVERHGLRRRLAVSPPGEPDAAAERDGVPVASPVPGIGPGGWRLIQVLAAAPLDDWTSRSGLAPAQLVTLPVTDDLARYVHAGWRQAVVRERSASVNPASRRLTEWVLALLAADTVPDAKWAARAWPGDAALAAALPHPARAERAAALVTRTPADDRARAYEVTAEVAACAAPWPPVLADAVVSALARAAVRPDLPALPRTLLTLAARNLPADAGPASTGPDYAAALAKIAVTHPQSWSALLDSAAETIVLRRIFLAEL